MKRVRLDVLLLSAVPRITAGTVLDHIESFRTYSSHRIFDFRAVGAVVNRLPRRLNLRRFDAVVIHYSVYLLDDRYLGSEDRRQIAEFPGVKVLFLQDEYRQINRCREVIRALGIDVLFTCVPQGEVEKVYPASELPGLTIVSNLTGYVPQRLI